MSCALNTCDSLNGWLTLLGWQRETTICELTFPSSILAVRLNRKRLAVVLEEQIYLYDISNMKLLYTIETSPNPTGKYVTLFVQYQLIL